APEPEPTIPATATPTPVPATATPTAIPPTAAPPAVKPAVSAPASVQITEWRGEYFNSVNLTGSALVRNDQRINFDWGYGSPMQGIRADNFSVRWTRQLDLEAKTYRFYVRADDGVRLWVDGQLLIDQWYDGSPRTFSVDRTLNRGRHDIRVEMYERTGQAVAAFWREAVESYPDWRGEYFGNPALSGNPFQVRNDKNIDFNWGGGAPAPGLPADNYSVRWTRQLHFPAGQYRFNVQVDDGARLWVDGRLLIDQWRDGTGTYSGDLYLGEGQHQVRLEMYEHTGGAMARLWWEQKGGFPEWKGEYFTNRKLKGTPALVRNDANINFSWGTGAPAAGLPADGFSVRWTRNLDFKEGLYRFTVEVDDGARLWVDDRLVIDQWHEGVGTYSGELRLSKGKHTVRMEMFEQTGAAMARLWWADQPELLQWKGRYYSNPKLQGEPVLVRKDKEIDFRWKKGAPADGLPIDGFSVRWTRDVEFADGIYRFCATADDGVRVSIDDGNPFINEWHDSSGSTTCQDVKVAQGVHRIKVEYYDNLERSVIKFWWDRLADG
ncbi:MAG TPA: PA14 domain-containing protein, partial [Anaerolineae bacterium]|nr:PA14 domain-containing protein [Anaerolineae bacterium]